jgi:hypothetical protein
MVARLAACMNYTWGTNLWQVQDENKKRRGNIISFIVLKKKQEGQIFILTLQPQNLTLLGGASANCIKATDPAITLRNASDCSGFSHQWFP